MLFPSMPFLNYFLPVVFVLYFCLPRVWKNALLLLASLVFYFCGEPRYTVLLVFSSIVDYVHSRIIDRNRGKRAAKVALISSIVINLSLLAFFKYADFFIANLNALLGTQIPLLHIPLPIGISFYTFQTMSYTIDVYRRDAEPQRNLLSFATYVSLFPQLIAGPIVRYKTVAEEIEGRTHSFEKMAYGVRRFVVGLGKKVLIANTLGDLTRILAAAEPSVLSYWMGAVAFSLQIYFDFSGYSDMAIGLGRMFGFHFLENFNYPYISKSISEFWNRWHISLGTWFKDYLYIPLGGNRVGKLKWCRNIFIVWFCTGFWHGASWNFILWGLYFGVIIALEKFFILNFLKKIPRVLNHVYVLLLVLVSFVIFSHDNTADIAQVLQGMFGFLQVPFSNPTSLYYLRSFAGIFLVAFVGATPFVTKYVKRALETRFARVMNVLEPVACTGLLLLVTGYLVDSSFNPFLYFRF